MTTKNQHTHNNSEENIERLKKLAEARKGILLSEEHKMKLKGRTPWNKNKPMWSEEEKKEMSGESSNASKYLKGKTYEEIYGKEKAQEIIQKKKEDHRQCKSATINLKGRTYENIYGKEKAKEQKEKRRMKIQEKYDNGTATFGFPKDGTMKIKRSKQILPKQDTQIEKKIQLYLQMLNLDFYTHVYRSEITHAYQCDISIPSQRGIVKKTIVECDGDWWHGNPNKYPNPNSMQQEQIAEDKIRTKELEEKGFRVVRLWESEINKLELEQFARIILQQ